MSYAVYNITASTSVVQVPTSNLSTTSFTPVVLLNSVNAPGQLVTIRDFEGAASLQYPITVSTVNGVNFLEGPQVSSYTITQPFGFMTVSPRTPSIWNVMNTFAFPDSNAAANINTLNANLMVVSSIYASGEVNMSSLNVSTLTVLQYLDIASTNIENAIVQSNVYVGELLSTGSFFAGDASTLNLTVTQIATVSTLSSMEAFVDTLTVSSFLANSVNVPNIIASTVKTERVFLSVSSPNESGTITWGQVSTGNHLEIIAGTGTGGEGYIDFYTGVGNSVALTDYTNRALSIQSANDQTSTLRVFGGARVRNDLYVGGETRFQASTFFIENATFQKDVFVSTNIFIGPNLTSSSQLVLYTDAEERLTISASNGNARIQHLNSGGTNDTPYIGFGGGTGNLNVRDPSDQIMMNFSSFAQGIDVDCSLTVGSVKYVRLHASTAFEGVTISWNDFDNTITGYGYANFLSARGQVGEGGFAFYTYIDNNVPPTSSNLALTITRPGGNSDTLNVGGGATFTSTVVAQSLTVQSNVNFTGATVTGLQISPNPSFSSIAMNGAIQGSGTNAFLTGFSSINGAPYPPVTNTQLWGVSYTLPPQTPGSGISTLSTFRSPTYSFNESWTYTGPITFLTTWNGNGNTNNLQNSTRTGPASFYRKLIISTTTTSGSIDLFLHTLTTNNSLNGSFGPKSSASTFQITNGSGTPIPASVQLNGGTSNFYTGPGAEANIIVWGRGSVIIEDSIDWFLDSGDPGANYAFGLASPVNAANNTSSFGVITYR